MAEVASKVEAGKKVELVKPEKPDEEAYKAALKKAEKEHADSMARFNAIKSKLDLTKPNAKDSPSSKRRGELIAELKEIREKQGAGKAGRNKVQDEIRSEEGKLSELITQQKAARGRVSFKSVEDLDNEIKRLEKQVDAGTMKLVDEKKALTEISNLRKQRKGFAGFDEVEKQISEKKANIKKLKDSLNDPESKALSERYNTKQAELDTIKAEQDDAFKNLNALRDEKTRLQAEQQEKYQAIRKIKDDYYNAERAIKNWDYQARQRARERREAENKKYHQEKKKERAQQILAEASDKAYLDEIRKAESLLAFLDPTYKSEKAPLQAASQFQAAAQRTVDDSGLKGMKLVKKEEEDYFAGSGGKKGKKGKNQKKADAEVPSRPKDYNCPPSVIETCEEIGVPVPMQAADVPATLEKVKEKLDFWKKDQAAQTERNIAKAQKEVERIEAEEAAAASGSATPTSAANGESKTASKSQAAATEVATESPSDPSEASSEDKE